jgi:hypothetical protein
MTKIALHTTVDMRKPNIIDNSHALEQMKLLKNKTGNIVAQSSLLILGEGVDIVAKNSVLALVGVIEKPENVEQGRLA